MKISKIAGNLETSLTRQLFDMAKNYDDVIDLTLGDPDVPPLEVVKMAACEAITQGKLRYSANAGLIALRESVAENYKKESGLSVDPSKNIAITVGGMEGLYLALKAIVDAEDEVIILAPYYVNYKHMINMCGGTPVIVETLEENGFVPVASDIEKAITEKTVAIVINTPCNPTGTVIPRQALEDIATLSKKHDLAVISDEVYCKLVYDDEICHTSIATLDGMQERTVVVDSLSKRQAMTGYRVGYVVAPEETIMAITKLQENIAACAPVSSQYAAIAAFKQCSDDTSLKDEFKKRRDFIYPAINAIDGLSCSKPHATFYLFVNVEKTGLNGLDFAYKLLEKEHVAVAPGITYGDGYENYIRIAYTMNIDKLKMAVEKISRFVKGSKN